MKNITASKKPFFSILMPVFNAEKYLHKSINSIIQQSFTNYELIIINDCSTDNSLEVCRDFAIQDNRIFIKSTTHNMGVANARNEAISLANGIYLNFVDADDYIDNNVFEIVHARLLQNKAQILKYGCVEEYFGKNDVLIGNRVLHIDEGYYSDKIIIRKMILEMEKIPLFGYVWNTFYDAQLIKTHSLMFDNNLKVNEDFIFNMEVFNFVNQLDCLNCCGYHYEKRVNNSLSTKENSDYFKLHIVKINKLLESYYNWHMLDNKIKQDIFWFYTRYIYSYVCRTLRSNTLYYTKKSLLEVFSTSLFKQYSDINFQECSFREHILTNQLQNKNIHIIILICLLINIIRLRFPLTFAYNKA